jgi:hypothetical protein
MNRIDWTQDSWRLLRGHPAPREQGIGGGPSHPKPDIPLPTEPDLPDSPEPGDPHPIDPDHPFPSYEDEPPVQPRD